ncbi:alpha/beta fold hydrolase [Xylophilus sp. GOD-11R]|uniref:alpha/beta fold hydrolase n=1 Tax=Xylophilus sp. GOD-11R TaxID=3089814 RepID=UPI00298BDDC8|nr:alpha/beta fold hydrolase [Xylophilus sp. GOD-11R]WPB56829.1 alpha/beta fold hydrolase [Xylophilus sp. GOD-11R]
MSDDVFPTALPATVDADADARALDTIARLDARTPRESVDIDGCRVVFRRIGDGPPLLLLHGGHGSWLHWIRNIDALAAHHTLWLADMPGYGDSDAPEGAQTLDLLVDVLGRAVDRLLGADQPIDIAGFSFGGLCAATLSARRTAVRKAALLGPAGHGQARRERLGMLDWKGLPPGDERDARLRHNLAALMLHDEACIDPLALALHRQSAVNTRFRSKGISRRSALPQALDALAERQVSVLLAWGEHDVTAVPSQVGPQLVAGVASRELVIVPNAGHWVQYEQPAVASRLLADWFA